VETFFTPPPPPPVLPKLLKVRIIIIIIITQRRVRLVKNSFLMAVAVLFFKSQSPPLSPKIMATPPG
jgi:hypothetical protein